MAVSEKSIPLSEWCESEARTHVTKAEGDLGRVSWTKHKNDLIIRKATVAYGISEILGYHAGKMAMDSHTNMCNIDNFAVRISGQEATTSTQAANLSAKIEGVEMLSPAISLQISEPDFLSFGDLSQDEMGRYLEIEILDELSNEGQDVTRQISDESETLYSFGQLLYALFSHPEASQIAHVKYGTTETEGGDTDSCKKPARKKREGQQSCSDGTGVEQRGALRPMASQYVSLEEFGFPFSLSLLVKNLLECQLQVTDAYDSLHTVSSDLHLLLNEPDRFLFAQCAPANNGKIPLQFRKEKNNNGYSEKLYGREIEVTQIQEAFCRVSSGHSEAFFIGGFSGSGKTRLVESLKSQVDVAGGYVITRKFDAMSKERPLLEVVYAFNDLCLLIKEKSSPRVLSATADLLLQAFGAEISELVRLLPNLCFILPQLKKSDTCTGSGDDQMNIQNVGFVLQRFMRVVSSVSHPVMLFLDDLQWCTMSALAVIEGILSDKEGSCIFFVGSYRSNEVQSDHDIVCFMDNLDKYGIPSTKVSLSGMKKNDLNTMLSDATGLFPRLCSSLSDIVFQKTKGNPYFMIEFLRSLVDDGLLEYSVRKRRWVWDEMAINSTDITDNVLFLLTNKMRSGLTKETIDVLKVVSCFGIRIHASVIGLLSATARHSHIRDGLENLVLESFMVKIAQDCRDSSNIGEWKFVHDKVQEAAYSLIADQDKDEYHKNLGQSLYEVSKGQTLGESVLPIVFQINLGLQFISHSPAMSIDIAELNLEAGVKCVEKSDYSTANSYLNNALSLLPKDSWRSHYNLSLQISYLSAKTAYCLGNGKIARETVRVILSEGRCTEDKVDTFFLLVVILNASGETENAYFTCLEILAELGENASEWVDGQDIASMVAATTMSLENKTEDEMMAIKGDDLLRTSPIIKFYTFATISAFIVKPAVAVPLCCRMVDLTLRDGVTKYSALGLIQFAAHLIHGSTDEHIPRACKIGKLAISLFNRFGSSDILARAYLIYFGFVAPFTDPIQSCDFWLKKGFEIGMSNGDTFSAFQCANHHIRLSIIWESKLPSLLQETDYYLTIVRQHEKLGNLSKRYLLIYRETIQMLIDKGSSTEKDDDEAESNESLSDTQLSETLNFHKALQSFWLGYAERCDHYASKLLESECGRHHRLTAMFYRGINTFSLLKRRRTPKLKSIHKACLVELKAAAQHSTWNYRNKVHLLEAEMSSYEGRNEEASSSYAAAILASRSSRFVHEQGLACELAGFHYKKIGDLRRACSFFNQANLCYAEWGSDVKVDSITRQLGLLRV